MKERSYASWTNIRHICKEQGTVLPTFRGRDSPCELSLSHYLWLIWVLDVFWTMSISRIRPTDPNQKVLTHFQARSYEQLDWATIDVYYWLLCFAAPNDQNTSLLSVHASYVQYCTPCFKKQEPWVDQCLVLFITLADTSLENSRKDLPHPPAAPWNWMVFEFPALKSTFKTLDAGVLSSGLGQNAIWYVRLFTTTFA